MRIDFGMPLVSQLDTIVGFIKLTDIRSEGKISQVLGHRHHPSIHWSGAGKEIRQERRKMTAPIASLGNAHDINPVRIHLIEQDRVANHAGENIDVVLVPPPSHPAGRHARKQVESRWLIDLRGELHLPLPAVHLPAMSLDLFPTMMSPLWPSRCRVCSCHLTSIGPP